MNIFELRTYTLHVGKLNKAIEVYENLGWPALKKYKKNIVRYYIGDVGALNQIIHVWQFEDDNIRRALWKTIYADQDFLKFATEFRPPCIRNTDFSQDPRNLARSPIFYISS